MDFTRWSLMKSDWWYSLPPKMKKLYTVSQNKTRSWLQLRSWTPYCQIQTEIEESRKNHYTIQVWPKSNPLWLYSGSDYNRFKGLDLIDRLHEELWTEVRYIVQEAVIKTIPMEKKCKKAKWLSEAALQIAVKRWEAKDKGEKERLDPFECRAPKNSNER